MTAAQDKVTLQKYDDCNAGTHSQEWFLTCSTWAHHASLVLSPTGAPGKTVGLDLDHYEVRRLIAQLQKWLDQ